MAYQDIDPGPGPTPGQRALRAAMRRAQEEVVKHVSGFQLGTPERQQAEAEARSVYDDMVQSFLREERENVGFRDEGERNDFTRGLAHGLGEAGTSTISGIANLPKLVGGQPIEPLQQFADKSREEMETYYNAEGDESGAGKFIGRMAGEGGMAMATGAGVAGGLAKFGGAGKVGQFGRWLQGAQGLTKTAAPPGFIKQVAGNVIAGSPFDVAIGAGRAEEEGIPLTQGIKRELGYSTAGVAGLSGLSRLLGKAAGRIRGKGASAAAPPPSPGAPVAAEAAEAVAPDLSAISAARQELDAFADRVPKDFFDRAKGRLQAAAKGIVRGQLTPEDAAQAAQDVMADVRAFGGIQSPAYVRAEAQGIEPAIKEPKPSFLAPEPTAPAAKPKKGKGKAPVEAAPLPKLKIKGVAPSPAKPGEPLSPEGVVTKPKKGKAKIEPKVEAPSKIPPNAAKYIDKETGVEMARWKTKDGKVHVAPTGGGPAEARPFPESPSPSAGQAPSPKSEFDPRLIGTAGKSVPEGGGAPPRFGGVSDASDEIRAQAEVARFKRGGKKVDTPTVPPYKSVDPSVENVHQRGLSHIPLRERIRKGIDDFVDSWRRSFVTTPYLKDPLFKKADVVGLGGETKKTFYAHSRDLRREYQGIPRSAAGRMISDMENVFDGLKDATEVDIVARRMFVEADLERVARGEGAPLGLTHENLLAERARLNQQFQKYPHLAEPIARIRRLLDGFRRELQGYGFLPEEGLMENYLPREVIDHLRAKAMTGASKRGASVITPGSLKQRGYTHKDYNRDMVSILAKYMTEQRTMLDQYAVARQFGLLNDARVRPIAEVAEFMKDWTPQKGLPPGHVAYNIKTGFAKLRSRNLMERMGIELTEEGLAQMAKQMDIPEGVLHGGLNGLLTPTGQLSRDVIIIPEYVAKELELLNLKRPIPSVLEKGNELFGRGWKTFVLNVNPIRRISRDLFGDAQRAVAQYGVPFMSSKEHWKQAIDDVWNLYVHNRLSPTMTLGQKYLVSSSGRIVSEVADVHNLQEFRHLKGTDLWNEAEGLWTNIKNVGKMLPKVAGFREDLTRQYIFLRNYENLSNAKPAITGIVDPQEVKSLIEQATEASQKLGLQDEDPYARAAAMIARRGLIDYGDFTLDENLLRQSLAPFYAWAKGNTLFWGKDLPLAMRRGFVDPKDALGGGLAAGGTLAIKGAATIATAAAAIRMWNERFGQEVEEKLPLHIQNQNHIILPDPTAAAKGELKPWMQKDKNGRDRVVTWYMPDALDDFFRWAGLDGIAPELYRYARGEVDAKEVGRYIKENMLYAEDEKAGLPIPGLKPGVPLPSVARGIANTFGPPVTLPVAAFGATGFPDPLNPRAVPQEEYAGNLVSALGLSGVPYGEQMFGAGNDPTVISAQPNILTAEGALQSAGLRTPVLEQSGRPSFLVDMQKDVLREAREYEDLLRRNALTQAGVSKAQLTETQRTNKMAVLNRAAKAKYDRLMRKLAVYQRLERFANKETRTP